MKAHHNSKHGNRWRWLILILLVLWGTAVVAIEPLQWNDDDPKKEEDGKDDALSGGNNDDGKDKENDQWNVDKEEEQAQWDNEEEKEEEEDYNDWDKEEEKEEDYNDWDKDKDKDEDKDRPWNYGDKVNCDRFKDLPNPPPQCLEGGGDADEVVARPSPPSRPPVGPPSASPPAIGTASNEVSLRLSLKVRGDFSESERPSGGEVKRMRRIIAETTTWILDKDTPFRVYLNRQAKADEQRRLVEEEQPVPSLQLRRKLDDSRERGKNLEMFHWSVRFRFNDVVTDAVKSLIPVRVDYGAFFKSNGKPILHEGAIKDLTHYCQSIVNKTIENGSFYETLQEVSQEYAEPETVSPVMDPDEEVPVMAPEEEVIFEDVTVGDGKPINDATPAPGTYSESLSPEWGIREWVGLGLSGFTLLVATTLFLVANRLMKRNGQPVVCFTEQGITQMLTVGWRYQQEYDQDQLYLQVYDKSKMGYSDDNSMLLGGVEQEHIKQQNVASTLPSTLPTSTASRMSDLSPNFNSSSGYSSAFSGSTPDTRSQHKYEHDDSERSSSLAPSKISSSTRSSKPKYGKVRDDPTKPRKARRTSSGSGSSTKRSRSRTDQASATKSGSSMYMDGSVISSAKGSTSTTTDKKKKRKPKSTMATDEDGLEKPSQPRRSSKTSTRRSSSSSISSSDRKMATTSISPKSSKKSKSRTKEDREHPSSG